MIRACAALVLPLLALGGCASVPDVTYRYFGTTWQSTVQVVLTVGCASVPNTGGAPGSRIDKPIILYAPTVNTAYSRDPGLVLSLNISRLSRFAADVDVAMTLTEDGRLEGINQSTTGAGEAIVKSFVSLGSSLGGLPKSAATTMGWSRNLATPADKSQDACAFIKSWVGASKPATLTYRGAVNPGVHTSPDDIELRPAPDSADLHAALQDVLPRLSVQLGAPAALQAGPVMNAVSPDDAVLIELQKVNTLSVTINSSAEQVPIAQTVIIYPTKDLYRLPIPRAALFGQQRFGLKLSHSGTVTTISYGRTSGVAGAANALNDLVKTQTAATEAAALKAQIDLIKNQQELWKLLADAGS